MTPRIHYLKTCEDFWQDVKAGIKTFELRRNDRGFQKGDMLNLQRVDRRGYVNYGAEDCILAEVTYVLNGYGLENGFVVMGLRLCVD